MNTLVTVLFLSVSLAAQAASAVVQSRIEQHRVGALAIGGSADDVYQSLPEDRRRLVDLRNEGHLTPALEVTLPGATRPFSVVAELDCDRDFVIGRIIVRDPAFRTSKDIGVGSTVRDLRAAYALRGFSTESEGGASVVVEELSATFVLDQTRSDLGQIRTAAALPDTVRIVAVMLWK